MTETITSPAETNAEVVVPAPGTADKGSFTDTTLKEMEAVSERRYGNKTDAVTPPADLKKSAESGGIQELRKSREEAIEKLKGHEKTLAERDTELTGLRKQVEEFDGTRKEHEALKARVAAVEKERDQYKKLDSIAAWENDPETHKRFSEPLKNGIERLKELAGLAEIDPEELVTAVGKTGREKVRALDELLEGRSRFAVDDIVQTIREMEQLTAERDTELADVEGRMNERRATREAAERRTREERAALREKAWEGAAMPLAKELGLTDHELAEEAEFFRSNRDAAKAAERTVRGGRAFDALKAERDLLKDELAKYDKAAPRIEAGVGAGKTGPVDVQAERKAMIAELFPKR